MGEGGIVVPGCGVASGNCGTALGNPGTALGNRGTVFGSRGVAFGSCGVALGRDGVKLPSFLANALIVFPTFRCRGCRCLSRGNVRRAPRRAQRLLDGTFTAPRRICRACGRPPRRARLSSRMPPSGMRSVRTTVFLTLPQGRDRHSATGDTDRSKANRKED
jgi:hypothetical protein